MQLSDFDYDLPPDRIAQRPAKPRDASRLMILDRQRGTYTHHTFHELPAFLTPKDVLVLNETRVIPARMHAFKVPTGGRVELLLLKRIAPRTWEALIGGRGTRPGLRLSLHGERTCTAVENLGDGRWVIRFDEPISDQLASVGEMPLPPYIKTPLEDPEEYQTIYAEQAGSSAAPTAGLHFTRALLDKIAQQGTSIAHVLLHIGLDTFAPVRDQDVRQHHIHKEWCHVPTEAVERISAARRSGGRVIAVGTTSVRALESAAQAAPGGELISAFQGETDLFILPGFTFQVIDGLITNFHLPRSTLVMMVAAFAGRENLLRAYQAAMDAGYRFYSFGDAMLIR